MISQQLLKERGSKTERQKEKGRSGRTGLSSVQCVSRRRQLETWVRSVGLKTVKVSASCSMVTQPKKSPPLSLVGTGVGIGVGIPGCQTCRQGASQCGASRGQQRATQTHGQATAAWCPHIHQPAASVPSFSLPGAQRAHPAAHVPKHGRLPLLILMGQAPDPDPLSPELGLPSSLQPSPEPGCCFPPHLPSLLPGLLASPMFPTHDDLRGVSKAQSTLPFPAQNHPRLPSVPKTVSSPRPSTNYL